MAKLFLQIIIQKLLALHKKVRLIDHKLQSYSTLANFSHSIEPDTSASERHSLVLGELPKSVDVGLEKELPLPPPPKIASEI